MNKYYLVTVIKGRIDTWVDLDVDGLLDAVKMVTGQGATTIYITSEKEYYDYVLEGLKSEK